MLRTHRTTALFGATALALTIGGCQKPAAAVDPATIQASIKADEKKWNEDFKAKSLEGLAGHYSDDAFLVTPGGSASGSTAIRKAYADALTDHYFSVTFASDKIDVSGSGDMAYSRGHFSETYQDPKTKLIVSDSGSYVTVYRKQADGNWRAVEDVAAADPATRKTSSAVVKPARMISF